MEKHILFLDNVGRTVLATIIQDTADALIVTNPTILQLVEDNNKRMKVQLIPLVLRDLQKDPNENVEWVYNPSTITRANITGLNDRFMSQYEFVTSLTPDKAAQLSEQRKNSASTSSPAPVVKLFDEEKTNG